MLELIVGLIIVERLLSQSFSFLFLQFGEHLKESLGLAFCFLSPSCSLFFFSSESLFFSESLQS